MEQTCCGNTEAGAALKEYALLLLLAAMAVVGVLAALGTSVAGVFEQAVDPMMTAPAIDLPDWIDDFSDENLTGWDWSRSDHWQQNNGQLVMGPSGEVRGCQGEEEWDNYVIQVRAILYQGNGYGVYFRATGTPNNLDGYIFQYDPGYGVPRGSFLFRKIVGGGERSPFARAKAPEGFEWWNVWRDIQVNVEGDTFTAYVDGEPVLQGSDDSYTTGRVGLRTWDSTLAAFDDLQVTLSNP